MPYLPASCNYIRGQLELAEGGFLHWQIVVAFKRKIRERGVIRNFGEFHCELTRSDAARDYVWKEHTRVQGTQFELGVCPFRRSETKDWEAIKASAISGDLSSIPADVYVRCYHQLRRIGTDNLQPIALERTVSVFWGRTGSGKSRRAWEEASLEAYPKDPNTKFWCGYRNHRNVVIDEFRGSISLSHVLRWFDRYPVIVEIKGGAQVLAATNFWITSNIHPREWYPDADEETFNALLRRLTITQFH